MTAWWWATVGDRTGPRTCRSSSSTPSTNERAGSTSTIRCPAGSSPPTPPGTDSALAGALTGLLAAQSADPFAAGGVIVTNRAAAQADGRSTDAGVLWTDIWGDRLLRNFGTRYAARLAAAGVPARLATWMHPVKAPGQAVPHCADVPLLFGTHTLDYHRDQVGASQAEQQLSDQLASAVVSFARDDAPKLASGAAWPAHQPGTPTSVRSSADDQGTGVQPPCRSWRSCRCETARSAPERGTAATQAAGHGCATSGGASAPSERSDVLQAFAQDVQRLE